MCTYTLHSCIYVYNILMLTMYICILYTYKNTCMYITYTFGDEGRDDGSDERRGRSTQGAVRLHRNAVFVVERTNVIDNALDVALKPADVVLSTPIAQEVTHALTPYVQSAGENIRNNSFFNSITICHFYINTIFFHNLLFLQAIC